MNKTQLIAIAIIIMLIAIYLIINIMKKGLRQTAIDLIVEVERKYGAGEGAIKMETATTRFLALVGLPIPVSIVKWFIQAVFDEIQEALEYTPERKEAK